MQNIHNFKCRLWIQISRWLICQQHIGFIGNGPRDGNPLLLTAGKFIWHFARFVAQSDIGQGAQYAFFDLLLPAAGNLAGKSHILKNISIR